MLWLLPLKRYAQFSGRSGRAEYWQFVAAVAAAILVAVLLDVGRAGYYGVPQLAFLVLLVVIVPLYAVTFRRLHDRNLSGWIVGVQFILNAVSSALASIRSSTAGSIIDLPFALLYWLSLLATLASGVWILVQVASSGDSGDNRFGPPPADTAANAPQLDEVLAAASAKVRSYAPPPPPPSSSAPSTPPAASSSVDHVAQLERLAKLHRDGLLTDAEFERQKAALLAGGVG